MLLIAPEVAITHTRQIVDMRNRLIHGDDTIEDVVVWGVIVKHVPLLKQETLALQHAIQHAMDNSPQ
jgi:uncharacterized protein with HEPN domain